MKTLLYYFTGTGNSLAVTNELCSRLGDCERVAIASVMKTSGPVIPDADRVGIISPLYFLGLPSIVAEFSRRIDLSGVRYVFSVITLGGVGETATLRQLDGILTEGPGKRGLDAGFALRMPGNYIIGYDQEKEVIEKTLREADRSIEEIARDVKAGIRTTTPWSPLASVLHRLYYPRFIRGVHEADRKFTVDDRCTACGTCAEVCPVGNIRIETGRPVWLHHCEQCMACIQLCPTYAIQAGEKTEGRARYRHPSIGVGALKEQAGTGIPEDHSPTG
ncbi:ferredoxin [Methanolinea mesophila]|uniref:EFR1 family ferrodoxin n=1 Tax=Methanolinea mesophila TaxID=547055 RepID=UPI001AEB7FA2|nr:EFR1 family ferrodoxin [Methanolinea mesophila]MBP1927783.1 ferredoxin [Methanolinea mesophila]